MRSPEQDEALDLMDRHYRAAIERIRRAILDCGLTEAEIALRVDLSQPAVHQIKTGKRDPSGATLFKLIGVTGIDFAELSIERLLDSPAGI